MIEFHNSAYLGVFLDEMDEQLQFLDEALLSLENEGITDDIIQKIFRAAHTLKGSSAAMGFERLKELTHQMESIFDLIRNGQLQTTPELLNILFDCVDYIKQQRQSLLGGTMAEGETDALMFRLDEVHQLKAVKSNSLIEELDPYDSNEPQMDQEVVSSRIVFNEAQKAKILGAIAEGYKVLSIFVKLSDEAVMKYVRAMLVYNNLKEHGEIVVSEPELSPADEHLFDSIVFVLITHETQQLIFHNLNQISQIDTVHIQSIKNPNLAFSKERPIHLIQEVPIAEADAKAVSEAETKVQVAQTVRVDVERLEGLLNLVGELIIDNTRLRDVRTKLNEQFSNNTDIALMNDIANHLERVIGDLQEGMMKTRMLPIEHLFGRFPRLIRDLAQKSNKEIDLIIEGKDTELDRTLIEEISDPLIHILRNSADHGLETPEERLRLGKSGRGKIVLRASHQGNMIVITVADDGRGINLEKIKEMTVRKGFATEEEVARMTEKELTSLIFRSGVSTANQVTDLSGRGVGMDIVRAHIEKLNGVIDIETTQNEGTVFTIKLPLTLAIIRSLLVKFGTRTFAIPLINVIEIFRLQTADVRLVQGKEVCMFRGQVLPLVRLHSKLQVQQDPDQRMDRLYVVIVGVADKRVCLVVDRTIGNQEIVIKTLGKYIGNIPYIAGSTILGDGHVAHILDVGFIAREAGSTYENKLLNVQERDLLEAENKKYVTFQLSSAKFGLNISEVKEIIPVPVINPLLSVPHDVLGMINLRGQLIPVYDLRRSLNMDPVKASSKSRIIISEVSGHDVGILVDEVTEVSRLSKSELEKAPDHIMHQSDFVEGIYKKDQQFIVLLHLEKTLNLEDARMMAGGKI